MSDKLMVLVVDDDRYISEGASLRLRAAGFNTAIANNGAEAIAMVKEIEPDAMVLDIRMPVMDGLSALKAIKNDEQTKDIPVVMLSVSVVDQDRALDSGARFFIRKPFIGPALVEAVAAATAPSQQAAG
ncbi:MAG: response regulator [Rubripirellula sp.]